MKGLIFAEGNGYGHVSREIMISKQFNIPIMTYGIGANYLKTRDLEFIEIPSPYKIENKGKTKVIVNVKGLMKFFYPSITSKIIDEFRKVDFIIVDGSPIGLILAKVAGKKSILITNDTSSLVGFHGIELTIAKGLNRAILNYPEKILVPDFPPPFTVSRYNLEENNEKIQFIGPLIEETKQIKHKSSYLVITTNDKLTKEIRMILGNKAIYSKDVGNVKPYYRDSKLVICHGGHTTTTESLCYGKPVVSIYDSTYSERRNIARFLEEKKIGIGIDEKIFKPDYLKFLDEIENTFDQKMLSAYKKLHKKLETKKMIEEVIVEL